MTVKLFLIYLKIRKLLPGIAIVSCLITAVNQYQNYQSKLFKGSWQVKEVISGEKLTVFRNNETKTVKLCGINSTSKNYLKKLIDQGNGSVELEKTQNGYEAWVMLEPDYEKQIHLNTEMIVSGQANLRNEDNCFLFVKLKNQKVIFGFNIEIYR